jgi:hypothetical protein
MPITCTRFIAAVVVSFGGVAFAQAQSSWQSIRIGDGSLLYTDKDVTVRGNWKALGDYRIPIIASINASHIYCNRSSMTCIESTARVSPLPNRDPDAPPFLYAHTFEYQIQEWSKQAIIAKRMNPRGLPVDMTLTIDATAGKLKLEWKDQPKADGYFQPSEQQFELVAKDRFGG